MNRSEQAREEEHFRKLEGAMLYVEDAARRLQEAAKELKKEGAAAHLFAALEAAADAVRADHAQLVKSVYWVAPSSGQGDLLADADREQPTQ